MALSDSTSIVRIPDMSRWLKYNFDNIHRASARAGGGMGEGAAAPALGDSHPPGFGAGLTSTDSSPCTKVPHSSQAPGVLISTVPSAIPKYAATGFCAPLATSSPLLP